MPGRASKHEESNPALSAKPLKLSVASYGLYDLKKAEIRGQYRCTVAVVLR